MTRFAGFRTVTIYLREHPRADLLGDLTFRTQ
jgi:hypothetical protein